MSTRTFIERLGAASVCLMSIAIPALAGQGEFAAASDAYRAKNYADAAKKFLGIAQKEPNNAGAAFYAASSYYSMGKLDEARNMFWYLAKHLPTAKEAYSARTFLKSIDPNYVKDSTNPAIGVLPVNVEAQTAALAAQSAPVDKATLVAALVETTPRRSALDIQPEFVADIKEALSAYPTNILRFLYRHNCHFVIAPNVVETDFRMTNYTPGGYYEGANMENVPALFNGRNIVIGEWHKNYNGNNTENTGVVGTMRHETGHAIDCYLGWISEQEEFKHQFDLDSGGPASKYRTKLDYFMRSHRECFAELACARLGGRTDEYRKEQNELLNANFPLCGKLVDQAMKQVF